MTAICAQQPIRVTASNHHRDALGEPRPRSAQGGPLPFPGDDGGQMSRPILPSTPSQDDGVDHVGLCPERR